MLNFKMKNFISKINYPRVAGSDNETKAIKEITSLLTNWEIDYKLEEFSVHSFSNSEAFLTVKNKNFELKPFGLNGSCNVSGELILCENYLAIKHAPSKYKNKIIMVFNYNKSLLALAKEYNIKAIIKITSPLKQAMSLSHRQKFYEEGVLPFFTIDYTSAKQLLEFDGQNIQIDSTQKVFTTNATNIVVKIKGTNNDKLETLVCAHYDSVENVNGASDNAAGTVVVLNLMKYFKINKPKRDLIFALFSGEELGLRGSLAYSKTHEQELKNLRAVLNLDVGGEEPGFDKIVVTGTDRLCGYLEGLSRESGVFASVTKDLFSSDGMPFTKFEIPGINIARTGGITTYCMHSPEDTVEHLSENALNKTYTLAKKVLDKCANSNYYPFDRKIDNDLKPKIEKFIYNLEFEKPELGWEPSYKK